MANEGCLSHAGHQKEAGVMIYLQEELGDARMRCDQLVRYITDAFKLVESSGQREQLFEVGGHLIHAIPDALFRLHKSLQAVALAADRLDYEELKNDLKPEKVQELERVLQEVRIRHVQHRSQPWAPQMSTMKENASVYNKNKFKSAADVNVSRLERMVSNTEMQLKEMRHSLELYKKDPGRNQPQLDNFAAAVDSLSSMARVTLRTLGKTAFRSVSDPWKVFANEAKESRYEEGEPADPTENMSPEDAAEWERNTEKHKDKFKSAAAELPAKFDPDYQQQLALMTKNPPKVSNQDQGIVIEVFSPFVKKYVPMAEYPSAELAEKDLGVWQKAHRETLQNLRASIKSEKSASISSAAAWKSKSV